MSCDYFFVTSVSTVTLITWLLPYAQWVTPCYPRSLLPRLTYHVTFTLRLLGNSVLPKILVTTVTLITWLLPYDCWVTPCYPNSLLTLITWLLPYDCWVTPCYPNSLLTLITWLLPYDRWVTLCDPGLWSNPAGRHGQFGRETDVADDCTAQGLWGWNHKQTKGRSERYHIDHRSRLWLYWMSH